MLQLHDGAIEQLNAMPKMMQDIIASVANLQWKNGLTLGCFQNLGRSRYRSEALMRCAHSAGVIEALLRGVGLHWENLTAQETCKYLSLKEEEEKPAAD